MDYIYNGLNFSRSLLENKFFNPNNLRFPYSRKLLEKKFIWVINSGAGKGVYLKDLAKIILKKYQKTGLFIDNKKKTYLIANNRKLKKITKLKFKTNIKKMIF